nr:immunoglobulin light chain junction region [Macaca mulatta]MOW60916.1 immunoglobulin light chain junction region [Macaca mulatta]
DYYCFLYTTSSTFLF